jgi:hypothetical protein
MRIRVLVGALYVSSPLAPVRPMTISGVQQRHQQPHNGFPNDDHRCTNDNA